MNPYYLKFADEAQAVEAMPQFRSEDGWITASLTHALDVVGTISTGGQWDEDGNEIEAPAVLDGFHVNLMIAALPAELEVYQVTPATPSRVFAGVL